MPLRSASARRADRRRRGYRNFGLAVIVTWFVVFLFTSWRNDPEKLAPPFCPAGAAIGESGFHATVSEVVSSDPARAVVDIDTFTIGTYNAEWLFDGWEDAQRSWADADKHIFDVGKVLGHLNADLMNIVELENCHVLSRVARVAQQTMSSSSSSEHGDNTTFIYVPMSGDSSSRQTVGVVSRFALREPGTRRGFSRVAYPIEKSQCGFSTKRHMSTTVSKHWFGTLR
mgnify:FL=1